MRFGLDSTDLEGSFRKNINNMSPSINAPVINISSKACTMELLCVFAVAIHILIFISLFNAVFRFNLSTFHSTYIISVYNC